MLLTSCRLHYHTFEWWACWSLLLSCVELTEGKCQHGVAQAINTCWCQLGRHCCVSVAL